MRRVVLVTGPPCAGKTSYVRARAMDGDQVLDQDELGAKAMRTALAKLRYTTSTSGTTWVIRCAPGPAARARLVEQLRAEHVHLAPPRAEVTARAIDRPDRKRHLAAIGKWYADELADKQPTMRHGAGHGRHGAAWAGRKGRPYRRAKEALHRSTQVCHLCGHMGAMELDHEPPRVTLLQLGLDPNDAQYHRAAHGTSCPCPVCGQQCNQVKGTGSRARMTCEW